MVRPNASKMTRPDTVITWAGLPVLPGDGGGSTANASFLVCRTRLRPSVNVTVWMWLVTLVPPVSCGSSRESIWLVSAHGTRGAGAGAAGRKGEVTGWLILARPLGPPPSIEPHERRCA